MRPALALLMLLGGAVAQVQYFGKELGPLSQLQHGVRGRVFAVDSRTLYLHDFHYDGEGPSAYFYVGTSGSPRRGAGTLRLRDERASSAPLRKYTGEAITLSLPEGKTLRDFRWFSVYCDEYEVNFGAVSLPRALEYPRPARLGALRGVHGVTSDPVVVVDAQTILVPNFSYDGEAPDAKFWVGRGDKPSPQGIRIPDENGKEEPLRKYDKKTIVLTLPGELTVFDVGHFAVWCEAFTVNFGHVALPRAALANVPPSLKMLGVSPQSKLNCEVLYDELAFEVRWAIAGDSIVVQLVGKLEDGEYMSFGVSGDSVHSQMVGGDVAVAWVDKSTLKGYAVDYYLDAKSQCAGVRGSCPDERLGEKTNSIRLLNAALVNGYSIVTYQRSLRATDELDRAVLTNSSQPIIWAVGPLNSRNEVSYHSHFTKGDKLLEFGRPPAWNCPMPEADDETPPPAKKEHAQKKQDLVKHNHDHSHHDHEHTHHNHKQQDDAAEQRRPLEKPQRTHVIQPNPVPAPAPVPKSVPWDIPAIQCYEPPDGVFYAQMGPTGGKQGYPAITGHVGWGISWYINGLLIPEINVVRGRKYTFVVEGGSDPNVPARYHPFYITNDPVGGYFHKNDEEKKGVEIYAGVRQTRSGGPTPTGVGRLCNWTPAPAGPPADEFPSFGAYQRALTLVCEEGSPGVVTWVPDSNTPDTVYYQCYTHRHLGWKINVLDECDASEAAESRVVELLTLADDMQSEESVQVPTRVTPDKNFLDERQKVEKIINTKTNLNGFSSYKGETGLTGEVYPEAQDHDHEETITSGQLQDAINTVESLESAARHNVSQYQVHEDVKDIFLPEQPVREDDEYFVDTGKQPDNYLLPPNQKPLTLQSVLRPAGSNKPMGNTRPPYRRPTPPEIKLRRPPPPKFPKGSSNYPLAMPSHHTTYTVKKPPPRFNSNRPSPPYPMNRPVPNMDRQPPSMGRQPPNMDRHPSNPLPPSGDRQPASTDRHPSTVERQPPNMERQPPNLDRQPPNLERQPLDRHPHTSERQPPGLDRQPPNFDRQPPTLDRQPANKPSSPSRGTPLQSRKPIYMHQPKPNYNQITKLIPKSPGVPVSPVQSVILGKPSLIPPTLPSTPEGHTLNLGETDIIANHVVKSQILIPASNDAIAQHSTLQTYFNKPGQIILGKPMDNPMPLDQQMIPTKQYGIQTPSTQVPVFLQSTPSLAIQLDNIQQSQNEIKSSDFIGESADVASILPAINTGFKPDSIVVESGFKPIIREPLMAVEDRIADIYDSIGSNRREDTDIDDDYEDEPQFISNNPIPSDKVTQSFEPMFVASPEDHLLSSEDRTKKVFPRNHAKEDRPHPVYVKTESELNSLFGTKNMAIHVPSDLVMESDKVSPHYLPPVKKSIEEQKQKLSIDDIFTTFDGKTVLATSLARLSDTDQSKLNNSTSTDLLLKTPQFGPFNGETPPPVTGHVNVDLKGNDKEHAKVKDKEEYDESTEKETLKGEVESGLKATEEPDEYEQIDEYEEDQEDEDKKKRERRHAKTTQFEKDEVQDVQMNGHSKPVNTVEFETAAQTATASRTRLYWVTHIVLLTISMTLL